MTAPLQSPARRPVTWLELLAVALVTFAVFTPVLRTNFSPLDDFSMIVENAKVTEPTLANFASFWTETSFHIYMPLALSAWQLIAWATHGGTVGGMDYLLSPTPFKVVSILTHALAAAGAVWALSTVTRTRWPAIVGGLIFALHPMQVEAIAWTTGLKDELCGLFSILAIGCYAKHAERDPATAAQDAWWWLAIVAALLATFSKPTAMMLPPMLLAVDWAVRRTSLATRVVSLAVFLLPALSVAFVILAAQGPSNVERVNAIFRPLVAADTYAFYLGKVLWPLHLSVDYGRRPPAVLRSGVLFWTWLFPAAALAAALLTLSRRWLLAAVLFVVPVLPVSGLVVFDMQQYSTVADHYVYQSLVGAGLAVALLVRRWPAVGSAVGVAALLALSVLTYQAATRWQNLETLYRGMLAYNPHSWMARDLLGTIATDRGDLREVQTLFEASLRNNPHDGEAMDNKAAFLLTFKRYREAAESEIAATHHMTGSRLSTAKRLTLLGATLKDANIAATGLEYWRTVEPRNEYVVNMLASVRQAQRMQEQQKRAAGPAATSAPTSTSAPASEP